MMALYEIKIFGAFSADHLISLLVTILNTGFNTLVEQ
jgi:uncharacterized membrane protein